MSSSDWFRLQSLSQKFMLPILCPRCQIRVLPSPEGVCPGCRKVIPASVQVTPPMAITECPECKAPLAENAVLCLACGYHLQRGGFLSTVVERSPFAPFQDEELATPPPSLQPPDLNPYASPVALKEQPVEVQYIGESFVADLTPQAAKRASAIVADAERLYWVLLFSVCLCGIAWLLMFPWYSYRLLSWYELNRNYCELRNPTPRLSDHYGLAQDFQAAKGRMWAGFIIGAICFALRLGILAISVGLN